jgi:hypothetical protein
MSRRLVALAGLAAICAIVAALPASGANFASRTTSRATVATDAVANYLRLYSDASDPDWVLFPYATKRNSSPAVYAATGVDDTLSVALGGYKNTNNTSIPRVFTVQARSTLPAGVSSITVTATLLPDPGGKQPLTGYSFTNMLGLGAATTVTLGAGDKRWLNLSASMRGSQFPGNNQLYRPTVRITVRYTGYTGNFLSYDVPVTIWDGNGAGP